MKMIIIFIKQSVINILNYEKESEDVLFESMKKIDDFLRAIMVSFVDVYLLARVFKN